MEVLEREGTKGKRKLRDAWVRGLEKPLAMEGESHRGPSSPPRRVHGELCLCVFFSFPSSYSTDGIGRGVHEELSTTFKNLLLFF